MSILRNQQQIFLRLWWSLQPHVATDRNLPTRLQKLLRHRSFGSRDRRLYRELLYTALRYRPWIEEITRRSEEDGVRATAWLAAESSATRDFRAALTTGWPPLPPTIAERARHLRVRSALLPGWFRSHCPAAFVPPNLEVLHTRAPLWIRLQTDPPGAVLAEFSARGWSWRGSEMCAAAVKILDDVDLTATTAYREGRFEIQDFGSQLILANADIALGTCWLDACAGAGGKTLQLAGMVGPDGRVDAYDIRTKALEELRRRARRGGFVNIRAISRLPAVAAYDGVLVDAPCSGSGTWRRAPHLKWCTTEADIATHATRQQELLARFGRLVRSSGLLIYATCSLSRQENQDVITAFLAAHADFALLAPLRSSGSAIGGPGLTILPASHDTDGFFVAVMRRVR